MSEEAVLALVFAIIVFATVIPFAALSLLRRDSDPGPDPAPALFGPLTPTLASLHPISSTSREGVRKDLLRAGYFEPNALVNFQAARALLLFIPLILGEVGAVLTSGPVMIAFFILGVVGGLLGTAIPRVLLKVQADRRTNQIRRGLPILMDTMGMTLSSGVGLVGGLRASGEAIQRGHPELAREVRLVCAQADLRSLAHALDQWKDRQPIPELGSLVFLLAQADRFGTDITRGLWELSASLRVTTRQRAEADANRTNFFMIFPAVLLLLPAAGLLLAGPGIVQMLTARDEVNRILKDNEGQQEALQRDMEAQQRQLDRMSQPPVRRPVQVLP